MKSIRVLPSQLIQESDWLSSLSGDLIQRILAESTTKKYIKGDYIHSRGDEPDGFYGVLQGRIKICSLTFEGKVSTLCFFSIGEWWGEISLIDDIARTHDAIANEDTEILLISKKLFKTLYQHHQEFNHAINVNLCRRLRLALNLIEQYTCMPLTSRLASRLVAEFKRNELTSKKISISQQELADMLGVSRQSVSKIMTLWSENKIIKVDYHSITILNEVELSRIAGPPLIPFR
ncbi:MAG: Crp/Fnr family transcriptional regulator [Pseudomonadota bacterium]